MKILVVGSGGREHAIIRALKKSPKAETIYALPGNGGIAADAICVEGSATDIDRVVSFSKDNGIDFVVVAPDNPLVLGMVDALNEAGIATFGPRANAAILEGSKVFSKNLMKKYGIPTARYETFDDAHAAVAYIEKMNEYPVVIKAGRLGSGQGCHHCPELCRSPGRSKVIIMGGSRHSAASGNPHCCGTVPGGA